MSAVDEKGGDASLNLSPFTYHLSRFLLDPGSSSSGNLGFTYGTQSNDKSSAGYLRVWSLSQSHWRLLFDVAAAALGE
jgi:hypothetical protein